MDQQALVAHRGACEGLQLHGWQRLMQHNGMASPSRKAQWLSIFKEGLGHDAYCIEVRQGEETVGVLPLCFVQSLLFGRFLVSMPYLNVGGVVAGDELVGRQLIDRAVALADELDVRYLEMRHERPWAHPALNFESDEKVHMRLDLPAKEEDLWRALSPKVRNQIRKAQQHDLTVAWGGPELLSGFYDVFSVNMRDLGTPVFGRRLFDAILARLSTDAEICLVRQGTKPVAGAMLLFGDGVAEVPSASSLRSYNRLNGNMLMYWRMLCRAIERGQHVFDFGRSSVDSNTYRFKAQWGATPHPATWQYYVRRGSVGEMRPDNPKQQRRIAVWRRLPVWVTRAAGPMIVRGIP
jgi:FemAB-related protein (PEP-CTERM system-associated)